MYFSPPYPSKKLIIVAPCKAFKQFASEICSNKVWLFSKEQDYLKSFFFIKNRTEKEVL